ncbi:MAG: PilZ domain-containing protein [Acidobacteria bacterium]|nr:PilZ domain-containing protein [Acidobacteriota bacterium]
MSDRPRDGSRALAATIPVNDRRGEERIPLRCPVQVLMAGLPALRGQTVNLSASGILALMPCEVPLGVELVVRLALPDGRPPLELRAMGVRQDRGPSGRPPVCVGLHLMLVPREALARIRGLIYG